MLMHCSILNLVGFEKMVAEFLHDVFDDEKYKNGGGNRNES